MGYKEVYKESLNNKEKFWQEQSKFISWYKEPTKILTKKSQFDYSWFEDGQLNTCYNSVDRHIENGLGKQVAIYYDCAFTNTKQSISYNELKTLVAKTAGMLANEGVVKGDRVVIYMTMIKEAVISMLACARIGAIHSVVFGGFSYKKLANRINDMQPKVLITATCGLEVGKIINYYQIVNEALKITNHKIKTCFVLQREQNICKLAPEYKDFNDSYEAASNAGCVKLNANDSLYILYTSGTTGKPKGVVRVNGSHAVAMNFSMDYVYGIDKGDAFFAASDIGWVVGHSYIVYGLLIRGCSSVLYEGKPVGSPDGGTLFRVCEEYKVNALFSAPTAFRAIKKKDSAGKLIKKYKLDSLRHIFLAGERCDGDTLEWLNENTQKPCIDNWWQTETGWAIATNPFSVEKFAIKAGSATFPSPGYEVKIMNEKGDILQANELGNIVIKLPLPPSCLREIWQDERRFYNSYLKKYEGYYLSGDSGYFDEDGYL